MADMVEAAERMSIFHGIPLSEEPGLGALTLGGYLKEVTTRFGSREALAIRVGDGMERWSYDELWARSQAVARALIACGVGKGTRVGVLTTNRMEFLSGVFGTALAGGVAATLSTFSTAPELEVLVRNSACSVLLLERHVLKKDFAEMLAALEPQIRSAEPGRLASLKFPFLRHLALVDSEESYGAVEGWSDFLARGNEVSSELVDATAASVAPSDPGVLFFSSGSTGKPKGILSSHRAVSIQLWRWRRIFALDDDVRCWTANGFSWSGNFCMAIGGTLSSGGTIVLERIFDPQEALDLMVRERVNFPLAWPHQWAQLEAAPNFLDVDLSAMRYVGQHTPIGRHPTVNSTWNEPIRIYGNTETFTISAAFAADVPPEVFGNSSGVPLPGNTIRIVDPDTGATVPLGQQGEIAVKGPTLMLGYLGIPLDETLDDEGFFRTGDGGYFDEKGRLVWEGRLNDIIKTGGANVSPVEIDNIIKTIPGVKATQTVGVPDEMLGELVVGCIVPHDGVRLDEATIRNFVKEHLASYKVPRRVLFFTEDELNLTGNAKIKASDMRKLATARLAAEG
ncbi:MAG: class I adenylate-forming enzyme family protein [Rhizomicrobium sp.]